jgi:serine/threonine protein kinase
MRAVEIEHDGQQVWCWHAEAGEEMAPGLHAWCFLGGGKYCEAWLAWSTAWWAPVVVKLPRPSHVDEERTRRMLEREAGFGQALRHPSIQRLLDAEVGPDPEIPYLVFEYVEGPTLATVLEEDGWLPWQEAALIGLQLAGIYAHLHGSGYVYLDSKSGNVALRDGRPVLLDLGIVREVGEEPAKRMAKGSPPYMAPEQCRRSPADPATDVFGLGAVTFELLTGERPFSPVRQADGRWSFPQLDAPAPRVLETGACAGVAMGTVPPALAELVDAQLAPSPEDRPQVHEVIAGLGAALPEEEQLWPAWVAEMVHRAGKGRFTGVLAGTTGGAQNGGVALHRIGGGRLSETANESKEKP